MTTSKDTARAGYVAISTDDHIIEPPDVWQGRLSARHEPLAPRVVTRDGREGWSFDGKHIKTPGLSVMAGKRYEEYDPEAVNYAEMRPGCYDPRARLADMDRDGIEVSVLFPTVPGLAGGRFAECKDKELALACLRAYNDWLADTWCAADRRRLIGQMVLPFWDLDLAIAELERGISLGHKAVTFPNTPETLGVPSLADRHWDRLWDAIEAAGVPVSMHIASGKIRGTLPLEPAAGTPAEVFITVAPTTNFTVLATLVFSGVLARHPGLKFLSVEGGIGWLGYLVERADETFHKHRFWAKSALTEEPSFYFRRQLYANFLDDPVGLTCRHHIGIDNILFETDYPHSDTTFPRTRELIAERFKDVPADETRKIVRDNAIALFKLDV